MELDPEVLDQALKGDRESFHRIAQQCWGLVYVFVQQRVSDPEIARDLTQDCFLKAYAKRGSLRSEQSFLSWLLTIAANKIVDHRRRKGVRSEVPLGDEQEVPRGRAEWQPRDPAEVEEEDVMVRGALDALDDHYRTVLILRYWSGLTPAQIARLLAEPEGTIRNRIFRAHLRLRERLETADPLPARSAEGDENGPGERK